jgi:glutamyl-tRNA synthetase
MGVTHVIRGDDHLNNAFRQVQVFEAMQWPIPAFAHIPLIHGADGAKLSKRHGALGVEAYRDMGFLPAAVRNYLLRLGWSHGDMELISTEDAIKLFDLAAVNKAPSRFDLVKLENVNGHYMREADPRTLLPLLVPMLESDIERGLTTTEMSWIKTGLSSLQARAKSLIELSNGAKIYLVGGPGSLSPKAEKLLGTPEAIETLSTAVNALTNIESWDEDTIQAGLRAAAEMEGLKLGKLAQPLRAALTGSDASPSLFEIAEIIGREETFARAGKFIS